MATADQHHDLHLKFETATRYYHAILCQDLFGNWMVLKWWGGKASRLGGMAQEACDDFDDGIERLGALEQRRSQRGYVRI